MSATKVSIVRTTWLQKKKKENVNGGGETWVSAGMPGHILLTPVFYLSLVWAQH